MNLRQMLLLLIGSAVVSCASTTTETRVDEPLSYEEQIRNAASVAADQPQVFVRYNPATCECPAFEVKMGSRWVRVALNDINEPDSEAFKLSFRAKQDMEANKVPHYGVKGELGTSTRRCAQDTLYLDLSVESSD